MLGQKIAEALLDRSDLSVRALVRNSAARRTDLAPLLARGVELVEGDLLTPASLDAAVAGVSAVISAVGNQDELIYTGQLNLLHAAERHGVSRFIPSDFSVDYRQLALGDNFNLDMRKRFLPHLEASSVPYTLILNGAFLEIYNAPFLGLVNDSARQVNIWGDGEQPLDFTHTTDVARYTAATVLDPRTANQALRIAGEVLSSNQLAARLGYTTHYKGTTEDLAARIRTKQTSATNPWAYLGDQYLWAMVSGKGKLAALDNSLYPEIVPQRLSITA